MLALTPRRPNRIVPGRESRLRTICVVDPQADDYRPWVEEAAQRRLRLEIVGTAAEALRLARTCTVDQWVINTALPGVSGCELCEMLRSRSPSVPIVLVSDVYSEALEREAYRVRASLFGVKPAHVDWLAEWLDDVQPRTADRAV